MKINPADLVGVSEIAIRAGVGMSAVSNWSTRHETFPAPIVELTGGKLWLWPEVEKWLKATGRSAKCRP